MSKGIERPAVALESLGCKLNRAEVEDLGRRLTEAGYRLASPGDEPDIYILNTCTVTHIADRKSRHMLRLARRRYPAARLIAIGCYAHRAPRELEQIDVVDLILGNDHKDNLVSILENIPRAGTVRRRTSSYLQANSRRTRAFIKIQDGCRNYCAFCIVPFVRTREVSLPAERVITEVKGRVVAGYQEVVLTGTEVGTYSCDGINLAGLLERILRETDIRRLRLSSLQPMEITEELIGLWRDNRLCPHFHLSLQSGSDSVLGRMKRHYTVAEYRRAVDLIRTSLPDVAITTDTIVGFPGETDEEFRRTEDFCRETRFARIHVFPFSRRPGTTAADMPGQLSSVVRKGRSRQMLALAKQNDIAYRQRFLGRTLHVLWEQKNHGTWSGLTGNYIKVYTGSGDDLTNKLLPVKLEKLNKDGVWGRL
jgi:threonylcarbamoyladenosine tRNA methylthiotransferase MtaB